jgi:hypothetical protein
MDRILPFILRGFVFWLCHRNWHKACSKALDSVANQFSGQWGFTTKNILSGFFSEDLAIDLGTVNTIV